MLLDQLFDYDLFQDMLREKYVRVNKHPEHPLWLLNYTEHAQYDRVWNPVTLQSRGLIYDAVGNVVARPFDKFFNYGEPDAPTLPLDTPVEVTDKMDGSLGILWNYKKYQGIATRGSFVSDQAIHATKVWNEKYGFSVSPDWTYLFEIVYPGNRIVLDYGDTDDLVLLGVMDIAEGSVIPANKVYTWRGPRVATFPYKTLREALEAPQRANAEGYVVHVPETGDRVKIKQEDYVQLHRIVTGLTKRSVWQYLRTGGNPRDLATTIPDEWHKWLTSTCEELYAAWQNKWQTIHGEYYRVTRAVGDNATRKEFALEAVKHDNYDLLFQLLDSKDIYTQVWDLVKPPAGV